MVRSRPLAGLGPPYRHDGHGGDIYGIFFGQRREAQERVSPAAKADFWTFRDGKVVEFHELYDTAALLAGARP
jgi:ketosteroid isomerase-like protein